MLTTPVDNFRLEDNDSLMRYGGIVGDDEDDTVERSEIPKRAQFLTTMYVPHTLEQRMLMGYSLHSR
jgi:hypothetical protein